MAYVLRVSLTIAMVCWWCVPLAHAQTTFAKDHQGSQAPQGPTALKCPSGTQERKSQGAIWCKRETKDYGNKQGPHYFIYPKTGYVRRSCAFVNNLKDGVCLSYRKDRSIAYKTRYKGDRHLHDVAYWPKARGGGVMSEVVYTTPKAPGKPFDAEEHVYWDNGKLQFHKTITRGKTVRVVAYRKDGSKASVTDYPGGDTTRGVTRTFDKQGRTTQPASKTTSTSGRKR